MYLSVSRLREEKVPRRFSAFSPRNAEVHFPLISTCVSAEKRLGKKGRENCTSVSMHFHQEMLREGKGSK